MDHLVVRSIGLLLLGLATCAVPQDSSEDLAAHAAKATGEEKVDALNVLSKSYWGASATAAMAAAEEALALATRLDYRAGQAAAWRNIGIADYYRADFDAALGATMEARRSYEALGDRAGEAAAMSTMGTILMNLERLDEAIALFRAAIPIAEAVGDDNRLGILYSNLGTVHLGLEKPREALGYLNEALVVLRRSGSQWDVLTCLANIGGAHKRLGEFERALEVNREILAIAEETGNRVRYADALADIALSHAGLGNEALALDFFERTLDYTADEPDLLRTRTSAFEEFSVYQESRGNPVEALNALRKHVELRGEVFALERAEAIAELEVRYETAKKEQEIEIQQLLIERQRGQQGLLVIAALLATAGALVVLWLYRQKRRANLELDRLARTDPLTGLANRRALVDTAQGLITRADRQRQPWSVVLLDIDHFKRVNDTFGHEAGDAVLAEVANAIAGNVRAEDLAGRWGGEEFLVLLPDSDAAAATEVAERIRGAISLVTVFHGRPLDPVTATVGVAVALADESFDAVTARADTALYSGKARGRDRVSLAARGEAQPLGEPAFAG
ncbi:MAG: tetratricopeptide repeat-containing diguanylate cyclase [Pseudomonadota bacterium]